MTQCKNLNIRIMFTPKKEIVEKETSYIYHWPRIISALLLFTMLVAAIYILYTRANKQNNMTQLAQIKHTTPPLKMVKEPPTSNILTTALTAERPAVAEVPINVTTENKSSEKNQRQPLFSQSRSKIFSEHIKAFVMAKAVINREPSGDLQEITFDHNNVATVYAFCLAVGLADKSLIYTWQLNGKQIAQIEVAVGANHWRSYSRKFIQPSMHGDWRVILGNKEGEILAVNEFTY